MCQHFPISLSVGGFFIRLLSLENSMILKIKVFSKNQYFDKQQTHLEEVSSIKLNNNNCKNITKYTDKKRYHLNVFLKVGPLRNDHMPGVPSLSPQSLHKRIIFKMF